jgi:acyl carrier protein
MDVKQLVRGYLVDNVLMGEGADAIGDDTSFLAQSLLDSTGVLELVEFLETSCKVPIEDWEIIPGNLDSLARIASFIERKQGSHVQAA